MMDSVEKMCKTVRSWQNRVDIEGLDDVMSPMDDLKFTEFLIRASLVVRMMDDRLWAEDDYAYLAEQLQFYYAELWSIATESGKGGSLYDRVLDKSVPSPQQ